MDFVNSSSLVGLGFSGMMYTWDNGRLGIERIQERLNRVLTNPSWLQITGKPLTQNVLGSLSYSN